MSGGLKLKSQYYFINHQFDLDYNFSVFFFLKCLLIFFIIFTVSEFSRCKDSKKGRLVTLSS